MKKELKLLQEFYTLLPNGSESPLKEVTDLQQKDIMNVRRAVDANIGRRVRVRANKGRHKYSVAEGVIQESYPSIFTVRINADEDNAERVVSYSYTDVLTRDVQLVICK